MQKTPNTYLIIFSIAVFTTCAICDATLAQDTEAAQENVAEEITEARPEAPVKVDVKPVARDEEIVNRLNEILDATKRFESPTVDVENGVVFLSGVAKESEFKTWASDLASNT